jgi:hypothetical protein
MPQDILVPVLEDWRQQLRQWSRSGALSRAAREALRLPGEPEPLRRVLERWGAGDFGDLPPVRVLPASAMPTAAGAYASATGTIYLNQAWLRGASRAHVIAVLTEELGHHLDGLLNSSDTPGDEGELLAALLQGEGAVGQARRQALLAENDAGQVRVGDQALAVEQAGRVVSTPIQPTTILKTKHEFRNSSAFAALRSDGSVVTWGNGAYGGDSGGVDFDGPDNTLKVVAFANPFTDDQLVFDLPPPVITLAVSPAAVQEDGIPNLLFTFTRTGPVAAALAVKYTVAGSATVGTDYSGISPAGDTKTVYFAKGATTAVVTVNPRLDSTVESDETVALSLAPGSGYSIGTSTPVVGTITNDDLPRILLTLSPSAVNEDGPTPLTYTFTRNGPPTAALNVNFTVGGTATFAEDYTGLSLAGATQTMAFAEGSATATLTLDPTADTSFERNETVTLALAAGTGYTIGTTASVTGTIRNDDRPVIHLALSPEAVTEDGDANLVYTFTRTGLNSSPLRVNYTLAGSATVGTDFSGIGARAVFFAAGSSTATVTVNPRADSICEPDETVSLALETSPDYSIGTPTAVTGTIRNDDPPRITLAISPGAAKEDGTSLFTYTFTRSGPTTSPLSVLYSIAGTATPGVDYSVLTADGMATGGRAAGGTTRTLGFAAGSSTATLNLDPTADTSIEPDEAIVLTLLPDSAYTIGTTAPVLATIRNDDSRLALYNAQAATRPAQQGWLAVNTGLWGRETLTSNGITLDSTVLPLDLAGYSTYAAASPAALVNPASPHLDRQVGFRLDFRLAVHNETHLSSNRAGFSVVLLDQSSSPVGIELGFQRDPSSPIPGQGLIFSQAGGANPFQDIGERVANLPLSSAVSYSLRMLDQAYVLLAEDRVVLTGALQDYSQVPSDARLPFNPYRTPNFLFLGDNTSRASARVELESITLGVALTGSARNDRYTGTTDADSYNGLAGADLLLGEGGNDWLAGGPEADTLNGGEGEDLLTGGSGADHFLFTSGSPFIGSQLGVDTLLDFNPSEDRLRLGLATFSALPAATALEAAAFAVVGSDDEASSSTALITYNSANGGLFYNPNGASPGFAAPTGDSAAGGGLFARLLGSASGAAFPALSAAAFDLV